MDAVDNYKIIEKIATGNSGDIYKVQNLEEEFDSAISLLTTKLAHNKLFQNVIYKHFWGIETIRYGEKIRNEKNRISLALKIFKEEVSSQDDFCTNFKKYFEKAIDFNHDNIIDINHMGKSNNQLYYVMEYVSGVSVQKEISTCGAYFEPTACRIIYQTSQALGYLHKRGIVHHNITTQSIILANNSKPKLHTKLHNAAKNDLWGIVEEKELLFEKDIRDLGIVFYEMLTGKVAENLTKDIVSTIDASDDAKEVLQKMLDEQGYQNCEEITKELEAKDLLSVKF